MSKSSDFLIKALIAQANIDLWCKDLTEKCVVNIQFAESLLKIGRGMPGGIKKMCVDLGYLEKTGEGLKTVYTLTDKGKEYAEKQIEVTYKIFEMEKNRK